MENRSLLIGRFQRSEIKVKSEKSEVGGGISLNHRDPEKNGDTEKRGGNGKSRPRDFGSEQ